MHPCPRDGTRRRPRARARARISVTSAFARTSAPAATARGSSLTCIACLASIAQPVAQVPHRRSAGALRVIGPFEAPIASAPAWQSWALRPAVARATGVTPSAVLDRLDVGLEVRGPVDPEVLAPAQQDVVRRPQAGAGVHHRRAPDAAAHRHRDRGTALAHRQAGVPVEQRERVDRIARVARCVVVIALLDDDHLKAGLREHAGRRGAARPGADDHDVAPLDGGRRVIASRSSDSAGGASAPPIGAHASRAPRRARPPPPGRGRS